MGIFAERDASEDAAYLIAMKDHFCRTIEAPLIDSFGALTPGLEVRRVLDVACGVGQALIPLVAGQGAFGVGIDISGMACRMASGSFTTYLPGAPAAFVQATAESLPFGAGSFDVVNCALSLPYTNNRLALAEMARVLQPRGLLILRMHHALYYIAMLWRGLKSLDLHPLVHAARVLLSGTMYHLTGRQPHLRWLNETFQTRWLLRKELHRAGLRIDHEVPGSHPQSPTFAIAKSVC